MGGGAELFQPAKGPGPSVHMLRGRVGSVPFTGTRPINAGFVGPCTSQPGYFCYMFSAFVLKKTKPTNDYAPGKNRKAEEAPDTHARRAHTRPGAIKSGSLGGLSSSQSYSTELLFPPVTPTPIPTERQSILLLKRKEGRRGAHCCGCLGAGQTLLLAQEQAKGSGQTRERRLVCVFGLQRL